MNRYKLTPEEIEQAVADYRESLGQATMFDVKMNAPRATGQDRPQVYFSEKARHMCRMFVDQCDKEIAWNGFITRDGLNFTVEDVKIFPQIVTGTTVDVEPTEYAIWVSELTDDEVNNMRAHCHSHVNMGVFSSGTDDDYQEQLVLGNVRDYYVFLIFNKKEQVFCRIYDVENNTFYDNMDIDVHYTEKKEQSDEVAQLIKDYVRTPQARFTGKTASKSDVTSWYQQMKLDEIDMMNNYREAMVRD